MIVTIPPSLKQFCDKFSGLLNKGQSRTLPVLLSGILFARGKRSQAALGRTIKTERRHRASISKMMRRLRFRTRDLFGTMMDSLIQSAGSQKKRVAKKPKRIWILSLDGVSTKRGGFTKIANGTQYKKKKKNSKGRSTKGHTFVMGLLITDQGIRIPVKRRTFYTRDYCKKNKKKYKTQQDLAVLMVKELRLPENVELVVVADEYFEGEKLWNACNNKKATLIVPVDSRRVFANHKGRSTGKTLHDRGKRLPVKAYQELVLKYGKEKTVSYRRYTGKFSAKNKRTYRVHREVRRVTTLGEANIVYSWKRPVYRPRRDESRETFKVLVCNNLRWDAKKVVEWYELRWQVELFFRELKSDLGMSDYQGGDFKAFERHVDLVLMAFLYLEYCRVDVMGKTKRSPKKQGQLRTFHSRPMIQLVQQEAEQNDLHYIANAMKTEEGRRELMMLWPTLLAS